MKIMFRGLQFVCQKYFALINNLDASNSPPNFPASPIQEIREEGGIITYSLDNRSVCPCRPPVVCNCEHVFKDRRGY
jgi:hypothetical protein